MAKRASGFGQTAANALRIAQALNAMGSEVTTPAPRPLDPMAGFATGDQLAQYAMRQGAFYLGSIHEDHGHTGPAGIADDRHIFLMAGTRAGKGVSFGLPNALTWPGPFFGIDPKGEMASIAALRRAAETEAVGTGTSVRHFLGQQVAVLDPLEQVRGPARAFRVRYNPLADIDMNKGGGVRAIRSAAASLTTIDPGNGIHFSETAETITAGLIEAVKMTEPPVRQTLPQCRALMLAGFDALRAYLAKVETVAGLATEAVNVMDEVGADEWGSHRTTLSRNWKWLAEPDMQGHLASSGFSLRTAVQKGWSVFVALPPEEISTNKGWMRLIVRNVLDAKIALGVNQRGPQTLCLLDEFPTLGRFKVIEESAGFMAGYGLKLVPIIQNIGQVRALYANNWETFLGNAGAIIAFGLNDLETEKYIADRLGRIMVDEASWSHSTGANFSVNEGMSIHRMERPVRFPNEIHEQGARETNRAFVVPASGSGFTVRRHSYTDLPPGFYDAPNFINEWEEKHWR